VLVDTDVAMVLLLLVVGEAVLQVASAVMSETASEDTSSKCHLPIRRTISLAINWKSGIIVGVKALRALSSSTVK